MSPTSKLRSFILTTRKTIRKSKSRNSAATLKESVVTPEAEALACARPHGPPTEHQSPQRPPFTSTINSGLDNIQNVSHWHPEATQC
jgi:hypothetical protein